MIDEPVIKIELIREDGIEIIEDEKYIYFYSDLDEEIYDFNLEIQNCIKNIKETCSLFIKEGLQIEVDGQLKHFTWKIEDQINLKNLIEQSKSKECAYYRASKDDYKLFTIEQLVNIFNQLENNKNYNLAYVDALCSWIRDNYTIEMYNNKEIIEYGYANDEIINRMEEILYGN